jgi:hypothetical protein
MQENSKMSFKTLAMTASPVRKIPSRAPIGHPPTMAKRWQRPSKIAWLCSQLTQ